jgi:hypothetical protein
MQADNNRSLLFVVGMHRSGTSALCAALEASGATFGGELLGAMPGVNDEGFWEDEAVVALNERLLLALGVQWYSVDPEILPIDWGDSRFDALRGEVRETLERGFGDGPLEVLKDPRLCITLPFWLAACEELGIEASVLVSNRAPLEVARSLQKRDAFPLAFGLRLYASYREFIAASAPADTIYVTYDQLLGDPLALMEELATRLPLTVDAGRLSAAVRSDLKHQVSDDSVHELLARPDNGSVELAALQQEIGRAHPPQQTLRELVAVLVERGEELTRIGEEHARTLATLNQRDAEIDQLGREHSKALATIEERDAHLELALATIDERDEQIREFDRRLAKLGDEHSYALQLIQSRDEQLQRVFAKPGIGYLFRAMWKHESG